MASRIACIKSADISKNVISITSPLLSFEEGPNPSVIQPYTSSQMYFALPRANRQLE